MTNVGWRANLIDLMQTLASPTEQLEYERKVPIANVPAELVCMWFDDLYHPESALFSSQFTAPELGRLKAFNEFYAARKDSLPESLAEMHQSAEWREVVSEAGNVLNDLGWRKGS